MALTLNEIRPIGLCITTQELLDSKRFLYNYCDSLILRGKDERLKKDLITFKRELNAINTRRRFLNGYKAIITSNIEKLLCLVTSRYENKEPGDVRKIKSDGKNLIKKILKIDDFKEFIGLESEFKSKITLPIYELFINDLKKSKVNII